MAQQHLTSKDFFELFASSDTAEINNVSEQVISRLELYLISVYKSEEEIAKDCAQEAFEKVYKKIVNKEIAGVDDVFGYFIKSARNEYLMSRRRDKFEVPFEQASYEKQKESTSSDEMFSSLYSEEKEKLLEYCIETLKKGRKKFFMFVLEHINEKDADAAKKIKMSHSSFRTKKSRVVEALRDCVKNAMSA